MLLSHPNMEIHGFSIYIYHVSAHCSPAHIAILYLASFALMASFTMINPFFEPGAPPPTLPIPLAQTELGSLVCNAQKLLAQEEISRLCDSAVNSDATTPYIKSAHHVNRLKTIVKPLDIPARHRSPSTSSESSLDLDSEDSDSDMDAEQQIPKPTGEAGRPGRGGYNLEETLDWDSKEFAKLKVFSPLLQCSSLAQDHDRKLSNVLCVTTWISRKVIRTKVLCLFASFEKRWVYPIHTTEICN
jgi:hypothetical protein